MLTKQEMYQIIASINEELKKHYTFKENLTAFLERSLEQKDAEFKLRQTTLNIKLIEKYKTNIIEGFIFLYSKVFTLGDYMRVLKDPQNAETIGFEIYSASITKAKHLIYYNSIHYKFVTTHNEEWSRRLTSEL